MASAARTAAEPTEPVATLDAVTKPPVFETDALRVSLGDKPVLGPLDIRLAPGSFVGILGPNGSGKTTLLRTLTAAIRPSQGKVLLNGRSLASYRALEIAHQIGVVPQNFTLDFSFTVEEMVAMGRYASSRTTHGMLTSGRYASSDHEETVAAALQATGLVELAGRSITQLSGGERQRALIAQTLAQDTPALLLDEPLNNLDLNHQLEIMQLLRSLHAQGRTIVVVLHDLNMAAQFCEELLLLDQGRLAARGAPREVMDPRLILEVFKTRVSVHRQGRRPYVTPVWTEPIAHLGQDERRRVHVIAGGGAASPLLEELVTQGFAPSVGVVSVFDTDYATAQAFGLEVVSSPPFEAFTSETMQEFDELAAQADAIIVAPVFFGRGNLDPLRTALTAAEAGTRVVVITQPSLHERDLSGGEATSIVERLVKAGAAEAESPSQALKLL